MRKILAVFAFGLVCALGIAAEKNPSAPGLEKAVFAGGCFWCMQPAFDGVKGVVSTVVGYTGGSKPNPTYEEVSAGGTGHAEAIEVTFDPALVRYEQLLEIFWRNVDPTNPNGQFCDEGRQYRSAIFTRSEQQKRLALASKEKIEKSGALKKPIVTEIVPAGPFTSAEEYHQKYYKKNPIRYKFYRTTCGRDKALEQIWGPRPDSR